MCRYKKKNSVLVLPVFAVENTLEEKGQPFRHHPLNSLLSVQALQRPDTDSSSKPEPTEIYPTLASSVFSAYSDGVMVVDGRGSGQHCGVTGEEL